MAHLLGFCTSCACNLRVAVQRELIFHCMPGKGNWEEGKKNCICLILQSDSSQQISLSQCHSIMNFTPLTILLPCFHANWLRNAFIERGKSLSHPLSSASYYCSFPLSPCFSSSSPHREKLSLLPATLFPPYPPTLLCAGLEIEMREEVGVFDWLRCWDVILCTLKCVVHGCWVIVCMQKRKRCCGNVWCSVYCMASSFVCILYLISSQTSRL